MPESARRKKTRTAQSLNFVLWFAFSVFALVIVILYVAVQSLLIGTFYRRQEVSTMQDAAIGFMAALGEDSTPTSVRRAKRTTESRYGVTVLLIDRTDGTDLLDETDGTRYPSIAERLGNLFSQGRGEYVLISNSNELGYGRRVTWAGTDCFVYVATSVARLTAMEHGLKWLSLATAVFSVVLAFLASGFVAMLITKPVTEVTQQAKELASGHYDFTVKRDYFCTEISELADALDYARQEVSKADAMQRELIANVSHDFKTPLTMIKGYASMILEISGDDKEKREQHARVIIEESDHLTALVEDLLDLSKLRAGVGAHAPATFNLSESVYKIAARFDYLVETQGYRFETEIEEDLYAYADRGRIEQVIYNLLGNAANYTGEDKRVLIRLFATEKGTRLEVEDTGKGIPAEEIDTIWDRYYRAQNTHKRPAQGTGLGLSIVKNILSVQGCPFGVTSQVGKGSCFWVEFPAPPDEIA